MSDQVVIVGSCMIDFVSYCPRLPQSGETIHGSKFVTNFGGKGANQCVAAAKLGSNTALVARLGDDMYGTKYAEYLKKENIDTTYLKITENSSSGIAQINVAETGENQIVIVAGANSKLSVCDVEQAQDLISNAAVLILQLETPIEVAIKAMQLCKGISILNGAPAISNYNPELLKLPTIFCINQSEAAIFTGLPVSNKSEAETAVKNLICQGCNSVLLTLGAEGAIYMSKENKQIISVKSPEVTCLDSTGAGDAFIGALAYFLANRQDLTRKAAIEAACFIAADSVTRLGTQISFPGPEILNKIEQTTS